LNDGTVREHRMKFGSRLAEKLAGENGGKRIAIFAPSIRWIIDHRSHDSVCAERKVSSIRVQAAVN